MSQFVSELRQTIVPGSNTRHGPLPPVLVAMTLVTGLVNEMLAAARARLDRVDPRQAARELEAGALLLDIRPSEQRRREGTIPGARIVERNVLEWRLDPTSAWRIPRPAAIRSG